MDTDGIELRDGLDKAGLREVNIKVVEKELHHAESTGGVLLCRKYKVLYRHIMMFFSLLCTHNIRNS